MSEKIRALDKVILPKYLGNDKKITKYSVDRLTAPGENYGSLMLKVDVTIEDNNNKNSEVLHTVAKMVPANALIQQIFNTQISFKKELEFYNTIIPTLRQFEKEENVEDLLNFLPEFYGGRISLDANSTTVDDDAIIILENLKINGYGTGDRNLGFDFELAAFVLKDLAILNAIPLALKIKKPKVFEEKILPHLKSALPVLSIPEDMMNKMIESTLKTASENEANFPYIESLERKLNSVYLKTISHSFHLRETFATLTHCDYWVNNTMIKYEDNKIAGNKIVDFQLTEYNSPAKDFLFFVFDSVQNDVIRTRYDDLLRTYHTKFLETLKLFGIESEKFSLDNFIKEIDYTIEEDVFIQMFAMLGPIFALEEHGKDVESFHEDDFKAEIEAPPQHKEKLKLLIEEFGKRGWLEASE